MKRYDKLLFVDTQNTCVSPIAEAIMQDRFKLEDILIESRGLVVLFPERRKRSFPWRGLQAGTI